MATEPEDRQVFVYGSLLHEPSLMATLAHRTSPPPAQRAWLPGWTRAWNVGSTRTFAVADDPTGTLHRRVVLGIRPDGRGSCEGLVLDLTPADLVALAPREAAYDLLRLGLDDPTVWLFVPRPERLIRVRPPDEPLVVERSYLDACLAGATEHGLDHAAAELVDLLRDDLPVVDAAR